MDTTYWVEFVKSDDTSDTIIREGRYELRHLTVILNCKRIQLFGIEGEYELKYAIFCEKTRVIIQNFICTVKVRNLNMCVVT